MAKYLRKKKKKPIGRILLLVAVILVLAAAAVFVMPQVLYSLFGGGEEAEPSQTEAQLSADTAAPAQTEEAAPTIPAVSTVSFPLSVDDGRLEINSLFQFSGINPDCSNQEGTDIAAIVLKNLSDAYLVEAKITLTLLDGTELNFVVTELPAGASVMAFSTENLSIPADAVCVSAVCETAFDPTAVTTSGQVTASADGVHITLTNISDQDISQIVVYCRSPLGEEYFGGTTYSYTVTDLPAGESASVDATDCILGMAEVVRIAVN